MPNTNKILIIKLSALGDFVQSLGAMRAIRQHRPDANITLLTTKSYVELAQKSGYFNHIIIDERPQLFQIQKWFRLAQKLNSEKFSRVYDLQCNDRTAIYFKLFLKKPEWVGTVKGASHRDTTSSKNTDLAFRRHQQALSLAGIDNIQIDTLDWMTADIAHFDLKAPYVLIMAGSAPSRPEKRWSAAHYATLCQKLTGQGFQPVLLGTESEKNVTDEIQKLSPHILNLTGKTNLFDIASLARKAALAIGNDTGPLHFIAPTGCKTIVLFSGSSNPQCHKPLGKHVHPIQKDDINDIGVDEVLEKVTSLL